MQNLTPHQLQLLRGASEWIGVSAELLASRIFDILEKTRRLPTYKGKLKQRANQVQQEVNIFHSHLRHAITDHYQFADELDNAEDQAQHEFTILYATLHNALRLTADDEQHPCLPLVLETATGYLFAEVVVYGLTEVRSQLQKSNLNLKRIIINPTRMQGALRIFLHTIAGEPLWQRICAVAPTQPIRQAVTNCYIKMLHTTFQQLNQTPPIQP